MSKGDPIILRKTILLGRANGTRQDDPGDVTVEIEVRETAKGAELSICGSVWQRSKRDIVAGGQVREGLRDYLNGGRQDVPDAFLSRLFYVWNAWHLNSMHAGCEHQRAEGWDKRPIDPSKPTNAYGKHFPGQRVDSWNMLAWVRRDEHPEGLLSFPCPVCGYKYGSAWIHEPLPAGLIDEIRRWPDL